jgi:hypothetical protein
VPPHIVALGHPLVGPDSTDVSDAAEYESGRASIVLVFAAGVGH